MASKPNRPIYSTGTPPKDRYEATQYAQDGSSVRLTYPSGSLERTTDGFRWSDDSGRWVLNGSTVGDVFLTHVPEQVGVADDASYRHELLKVEGKVHGVEVSGYAHQDFAYGPTGKVYAELPIARQLQGMWVSWLHEFDDSELGGGCFWEGGGIWPSARVTNSSRARRRYIRTSLRGRRSMKTARIVALDVAIGAMSYRFDFNSSGSTLQVFGPLTDSPSGRLSTRSWCWVDYAGELAHPEILDMRLKPFGLAHPDAP